MIDTSEFTLEDMEVVGKEAAPEVTETETQVETEVTSEAPKTEAPVVEDTTTPVETTPESSDPVQMPDLSDLTNGAYSSVEDMWQELKDLKENPTPAEPSFKDDYIKKAVEYYEKNGDLKPFLEATKHNYDEMSDVEVLRTKMKSEYKGLSDENFEKVFNREIERKFNPDEDESLAEELMKREANQARNELKAKQDEFMKPQADDTVEKNDEAAKVAASKELEQWKETVESNKDIQSFLSEKKISYTDGEETFTFEVEDPEFVKEAAIDNNKIFQYFVKDVKGQPTIDFAKFTKAMVYLKNPEKVEKELIKYGRSLGSDKVLDELENPAEIKTPNRQGTALGGGILDEWLQAVRASKKS